MDPEKRSESQEESWEEYIPTGVPRRVSYNIKKSTEKRYQDTGNMHWGQRGIGKAQERQRNTAKAVEKSTVQMAVVEKAVERKLVDGGTLRKVPEKKNLSRRAV